VSSWTGIPVERMSDDETAKLAGLVGWGCGVGRGGRGWRLGTPPNTSIHPLYKTLTQPKPKPHQTKTNPPGHRPAAARHRPGRRLRRRRGGANARALRPARPRPPRRGAAVRRPHGGGQDGAGARTGGPLLRQPGGGARGCLGSGGLVFLGGGWLAWGWLGGLWGG